MKILEKVITVLVALLLLTPNCVNALEDDIKLIYPTSPLPEVKIEADSIPENYARVAKYRGNNQQLMQEMEELVKEAVLKEEKEINISNSGIDVENYSCLQNLKYYSPYLSKIDITIYYSSATNSYTRICINNRLSLKETKKYFNEISVKLKDIYDRVDSQYTDEQIALTVHDYIISNYIYDYNYSTGDEMYCSGGLLYNGKGVCNAYAYLYNYIMHRYNIECYVTSSDSMNHAWNIIKIDNNYYHVDCTWDDPIYSDGSDNFGQADHTYFLKSDKNFINHSGWNRTDLVCHDEKYDDYYWKNICSPIIIKDNYAYYIANEANTYRNLFKKRNLNNGDEIVINTFGLWNVWNSNYSYLTPYSGLFINDGYIYYNTSNTINKFSISNNQNEIIYNQSTEEGYIYGIVQKGKDIAYTIKQSPQNVNNELFSKNNLTLKQYIFLGKKVLSLTKGDIYSLEYYSSSEHLQWKSNNTNVITVDSNGKIEAVGTGLAIITVSIENNQYATCEITVNGNISNCTITDIPNQIYTGKVIEPIVTLNDGSSLLVKEKDYIITYQNNINAGTATATIKGKGNYTGTKRINFIIQPRESNELNVELSQSQYEYDGQEKNPTLKVTDKEGKELTKNDYDVIVPSGRINFGSYIYTVKLKGNYKGQLEAKLEIVKANVKNLNITIPAKIYTGKVIEPIQSTSMYDVIYQNNINVGIATAVIIGKGNYTGTEKINFVIQPKKADEIKVELSQSQYEYDGKEKNPSLKVTDKEGKELTSKDYDVIVPSGRINAGTYTYTVKFKGNYTGETNVSFTIKEIQPTSVKLNATSKTIQKGKTYTLIATVAPSNATNKKVTYATSNSKVATVTTNGTIKAVNYGTAIITAKTSNGLTTTCKVTVPYTVKYNLNGGTNNKSNPTNYYGKKITLQNPTRKGYVFAGWYSDSKYKTKITSFSSGNKVLYAKWNKVTMSKAKTPTLTNIATRKLKVSYGATSGVKGYQIQYATNSKFTGSKTKTTSSRSYTITSLTKGKRYYVRVRGYKTDSTGNKVYGSWSTVKNIKISK